MKRVGWILLFAIVGFAVWNHQALYEFALFRTVDEVFDPGDLVTSNEIDLVDCRWVYRKYRFGPHAGEVDQSTVYHPNSPVKKSVYDSPRDDGSGSITQWDARGVVINQQILKKWEKEYEVVEELEGPPWLHGVEDQSLSAEDREQVERSLATYICHTCRVKKEHRDCWYLRGPDSDGMRCNCSDPSHEWNQ